MRRGAALAMAVSLSWAPAVAETGPLILASAHGSVALSLFDIAEIAVSESGGVAEIFITLMPGAQLQLAALQLGQGERLSATICGLRFLSAPQRAPLTGHLYLIETTTIRGWALQSLWQGAATCETLLPDVFRE